MRIPIHVYEIELDNLIELARNAASFAMRANMHNEQQDHRRYVAAEEALGTYRAKLIKEGK